MSRNVENSSLDAVLNSSGPEQLDYLHGALHAERIVGPDAVEEGVSQSLLHGRIGEQIDAIGAFIPGVDQARNIAIAQTYASGEIKARKVLSEANPSTLHVLLDMPKRLDVLTGNYSAQAIGRFALALSSRIVEVAQPSELAVYANDGTQSARIYTGQAHDAYRAYTAMDLPANLHEVRTADASLKGLLDLSNRHIDEEHDAVVLFSDFRDGYDRASGEFDWTAGLRRQKNDLGDRLWAVRVTSPSQTAMPVGNAHLEMEGVLAANRNFAETAAAKEQRIAEQLRGVRHTTIDTFRENNPDHPVRMLTKFVLGEAPR